MFSFATRCARSAVNSPIMSRAFGSSSTSTAKVAVLGAAGGIGQPLSLLLKLSPEVGELTCYDIVNTPGVAADLSHIPTCSKVAGMLPPDRSTPVKEDTGLQEALTGCSVVVIPAGIPRKPGMSRDDLFSVNAGIVKTLVEGCATYCPDAFLAIISNPVNSTVPIAAEVLKKAGVYNPKKLAGVTTLDVCRANTFVSEAAGLDPTKTKVTVIGGHAGTTILPLYSQIPEFKPTDEELEAITVRTQFGGDEVVKAKAGTGSATLSMAYAGYVFAEEVLRGLRGAPDIVQCAFVESTLTDSPFFASPCKLGPNGIEEVLPFGPITEYEQKKLDEMLPSLKANIQKGIDFTKQ